MELKACPSCPPPTIVKLCEDEEGAWYVRCSRCGPFNPPKYGSKQEALRNWNRRPIESALAARVAELEAMLDIAAGKATEVNTGLYDGLRKMVEPSGQEHMDSYGRSVVAGLVVHAVKYLDDERKRSKELEGERDRIMGAFREEAMQAGAARIERDEARAALATAQAENGRLRDKLTECYPPDAEVFRQAEGTGSTLDRYWMGWVDALDELRAALAPKEEP